MMNLVWYDIVSRIRKYFRTSLAQQYHQYQQTCLITPIRIICSDIFALEYVSTLCEKHVAPYIPLPVPWLSSWSCVYTQECDMNRSVGVAADLRTALSLLSSVIRSSTSIHASGALQIGRFQQSWVGKEIQQSKRHYLSVKLLDMLIFRVCSLDGQWELSRWDRRHSCHIGILLIYLDSPV